LQYSERFIPVSFQEWLDPSDEETPSFLMPESGGRSLLADNTYKPSITPGIANSG
jgi:hypothetical protein